METTKPKIIFKVTYYKEGKLQLWPTIKSHAYAYWITRGVPYLSNLGDKIDYFFKYHEWPTTTS